MKRNFSGRNSARENFPEDFSRGEPKKTSFAKILIIGYPKTGKTTLSAKIAAENPGCALVHTDSYISLPYREQLYALMDDLRGMKTWVVEGIQGYRLLRKIAERRDEDLRPSRIIICQRADLPEKYLKQAKGLRKVWEDYVRLENKVPPMEVRGWRS